MAYLHNGDLKPTTIFSFYPCIHDSVYLEGLKEGEIIQSSNPFFFQNANGYLAIDDRFTSMQIAKDGIVVQIINLTWDKTCTTQSETHPIIAGNGAGNQPQLNYGYSSMMVLSAGMLVIIIARRFFRAHK